MKDRIGESRWVASFYDVLEYDEWVFRSIRGKYGYLIRKTSLTWGKRSTKHGDYGWLDKNIRDYDRRKFRLEQGLPHAKTKSGALTTLAASIRDEIKRYGADFVEDYEGEQDPEPALSVKLSRVLAAKKRLK